MHIVFFCTKMPFILLLLLVFIKNVFSGSDLDINEGIDAQPHEYPYILRAEFQMRSNYTSRNFYVCTCTALSHFWSLTSAHCVDKFYEIRLTVIEMLRHGPPVGIPDMRRVIRTGPVTAEPWPYHPSGGLSFSDIVYSVKHPSYKRMANGYITHVYNDVGLLQSRLLRLGQFARLSAVDTMSLVGRRVRVVGYGTNASLGVWVPDGVMLLKALKVWEVTVVGCPSPGEWVVYPAACASPPAGAEDASGPVFHRGGIVAIHSPVDTDSGRTDMFLTAVAPYFDWITRVIRNG